MIIHEYNSFKKTCNKKNNQQYLASVAKNAERPSPRSGPRILSCTDTQHIMVNGMTHIETSIETQQGKIFYIMNDSTMIGSAFCSHCILKDT